MHWGSLRQLATALAVGIVAVGAGACSGDDASESTTALLATQPATTSSTSVAATTTPVPPPTSTVVPLATTMTFAYPGAAWDTIDAGDAGLDRAALDQLAVEAEAAGSSCTAIVRDGKLVESRAWGALAVDEPREAWSVTKSVTSTLVGIAQDQGLLTVADRVSTYVPEWVGTPSEVVTIRDILSNASGRQWSADTDYLQMAFGAEDKTAFAIALGQDAAPGEVWAYNNSAIQVLDAVLQAATGESPAGYARRVLFGPLGMTSSHLATDTAGNTLMFAGMRTTCLDLARFGYLMLHGGEWNGTQILSGDYVARATGESSTELNAAYGWLWWLNRRGPIGSALIATSGPGNGSIADGQLLPDQSEDTFWALGLFEQIVAVIPTEDIVAVRMGNMPPNNAPFAAAEFTGGVLRAVVEHRS